MNIDRLAEEYLKQTAHVKAATERKDELKNMLMAQVEKAGEQDSSGHYWLAGGEYLLKRERRVSKFWNADAAEAWAKEMGITDDVTTTVTQVFVDPDKIAAYAFLHPEVESVVRSFNTEKVTWAFAAPTPQKKYEY
jgi:hypothetical protein